MQLQLTLPLTPSPGSELTSEPFRWDQRLFSFSLQFATTPTDKEKQKQESNGLALMCEVTGGNIMQLNGYSTLQELLKWPTA